MKNPFLIAAQAKNFNIIDILIENGLHHKYDLSERDNEGKNLIYHVMLNFHYSKDGETSPTQLLDLLIKNKCNPFEEIVIKENNKEIETKPAYQLFRSKKAEYLDVLFQGKTDSQILDFLHNKNLVHKTINYTPNKPEVYEWFFNKGFDVNTPDTTNGNTLLMNCTHQDDLQYLISKGADLFQKNNLGIDTINYFSSSKSLNIREESRSQINLFINKYMTESKEISDEVSINSQMEVVKNILLSHHNFDLKNFSKFYSNRSNKYDPQFKLSNGESIAFTALSVQNFRVLKRISKKLDLLHEDQNGVPFIVKLIQIPAYGEGYNSYNSNIENNVQNIELIKMIYKDKNYPDEDKYSLYDFISDHFHLNKINKSGKTIMELLLSEKVNVDRNSTHLLHINLFGMYPGMNSAIPYEDERNIWNKPPVDEQGNVLESKGNMEDILFQFIVNTDSMGFVNASVFINNYMNDRFSVSNPDKTLSWLAYYINKNKPDNKSIEKLISLISEGNNNQPIIDFISAINDNYTGDWNIISISKIYRENKDIPEIAAIDEKRHLINSLAEESPDIINVNKKRL